MNRRTMLIGVAALVSSCATSRSTASALERGLWRDEQGALAIGRFPEFGEADFAFDYANSRVGALVERGAAEARISSTLNGAGAPIASITANGSRLGVGGRQLRSVPIERRTFEAYSTDAIIAAEVATPSAAKGTILQIYGSGPAPKEAFDLWAFWFLSKGYAVITYDKRGSGRSTGDWRLSGLETLAGDAMAVLAAAKSDLRRPLFGWGASQAGWILPQLGAAHLLDGFVLHAGSAMRPADQILAQVEAELSVYGFADDEIEKARAYYALDTDVSRGKRPWADIQAAYDGALASGAEWLLAPPAAIDAPERTMIRLMADFDPAPYWRANRASALALFGSKDWIVPAEANLVALQRMANPNSSVATRILQNANHLMFESVTGLRDEYPTRWRVVPEYFNEIEGWLSAQV